MLKGAPLAEEGERYGIVASPDPPYEVLRTGALSYEDLLELHRIEDMLEKYYNGGVLRYGLEAMVGELGSFSEVFRRLAGFWLARGGFGRQWSRRDLMDMLHPFLLEILDDEARARCIEALRFDYYLAGNPAQNLPEWLAGPAEGAGDGCYVQQDKEVWRCRLPGGHMVDRRQWARRTSVSCFGFDVPREFLSGGGLTEKVLPEMGVSEEGGFWYLFCARVGEKVEVFAWN
ncbi:MAG: DUF4080 domain-containing protein [Peptococcaceae bacterium]|nr:DUF4080 domain-containing protein [Peptococcaceae bacterium]